MDFLEKFYHKFQENRLDGKSFYYNEKLKFSSAEKDGITKIYDLIKKYIEGVQFVLLYYYRGCPSWDWFYPYYYSPMISDVYEYLKYANQQKINLVHEFNLSQPFSAFKQLLLIMPLESIELLPEEYAHLMKDPKSILRSPIDYYPTEFEIDPNDALFESEFVAILPFLEDKLLDQAFSSVNFEHIKEKYKDRCGIGKCIEYFYEKKGKKIVVESFLTKFCQNFEGKIHITEFLFEEIKDGKFKMEFFHCNNNNNKFFLIKKI